MTLFGARPRRSPWTGSRALVAVDPDRCPVCGAGLTTERVVEEPLLRHGGYGAARAVTVRRCAPCRYLGGSAVDERRPGAP